MRPRTIHRRAALALAVLAVATLNLAMCARAEAHVLTPQKCRTIAIAAALETPPATPAEVTKHRQRCHAVARRHAATHRIAVDTRRCLRVRGSGMGTGMCRAIATVRPAWAADRAYHELLRRESTWDPNAVNDSSDACGAFQRLVRRPHRHGGRGCPWAFTVVGWQGRRRIERVHATPLEQTRNGVRYIAGRYGSPAAALRFHDAQGWY